MCNSSSSKSVLGMLIFQHGELNTGFLVHFPNFCLGCVFHRTSKSKITEYFLISLNETQGLKMFRINDANSLVEIVCENFHFHFFICH